MCVFATSTLCYVGVAYKQVIQTRPIYADCSEVYLATKKDGIYEIQSETGPPRFTYCHKGFTLVQKLDPDSGNNPFYFERSFHNLGVEELLVVLPNFKIKLDQSLLMTFS